MKYRGRFAPTPSGALHFGSLVAATASYLDARRQGGEWLVRIEDLDGPRVMAGAASRILKALEAFGFMWDGEVVRQSERTEAYRAAFEHLQKAGEVYACGCSRAEQEGSGCGAGCRTGLPEGRLVRSWRVNAGGESVCWTDRLLGQQCDALGARGDFVILRGDGIFAYQLAVVVDDEAQGITDVVRGADLLDCTARQIRLQRLLSYAVPRYLHVPLARNGSGEKLSKQTRAPEIAPGGSVSELVAALRFLGQPMPPGFGSLAELWAWAEAAWDVRSIPIQAATA